MRHGCEKVGARILDQGLDLALVVALTRTAKPFLKQVMADEFREGAGALALAVPKNTGHRNFEIVVQNRYRHAAKKGKRRDVPIEKGVRRLRRIGLDETCICLRKV